MKKTIFVALTSIILTVLATFIVLEIQAQKDQLRGDFIEEIDSKILNESRKLLIHLPKGYTENTKKSYPIVFALDGTSHDQIIANAAYTLNYAKIYPDIIVVGIPNTNRKRDLTPSYITQEKESNVMGKGNRFLSFLEQEAIPFLAKKYRLNGYRMLSGNSRGGLFVMYALMEKSALFNAYFCFSPAFWRNDNRIVEKMKERLQNKEGLNAFLYLSLGTEENVKMKKGFEEMVSLLEGTPREELKFTASYTEGATHATNAYYATPEALMLWKKQR